MLKFIFSWIFILLSIGCASNQFNPSWQYKIENSLGAVNVLELNEYQTKSKLLQVNFNVKNESNVTKKIRYKVVWFDNNQQPVETILSNWKNVNISSNNIVYLTAIAPNESVSSYKILIN
jgi:uncharacterized protein YcfL